MPRKKIKKPVKKRVKKVKKVEEVEVSGTLEERAEIALAGLSKKQIVCP